MTKLWNDVDLARLKPTVCEYIRNGSPSDTLKLEIEKFSLFMCIQKEEHNGIKLIHVSISIMDLEIVEVCMAITHSANLKRYMEEIIQACFGYDFLLIERAFDMKSMQQEQPIQTASSVSSDPSKYVYHWFYNA